MDELLDDVPLRVNSITIVGNERTRNDFIERELLPAAEASTTLESYGIFDKVHFELKRASAPSSSSTSLSSSSPSPPSSLRPSLADVVVHVSEKKLYAARIGVYQYPNTQRTSMKVEGVLRNLFGSAERLEASTEATDASLLDFSRTFSLSMTRPRFFSSHLKSHVGINSNILNLSQASSYHEHSRGLTFSLSDRAGVHELGYEAALRELYPMARERVSDEKVGGGYEAPSESVVKASIIPSTKSSVKYTYTRDRLDSRIIPTTGTFFQGKGEAAGLGGDVRFLKGQVDVKYYRPVHPLVTLGVSLMGGALHPLSSHPTRLSDRYFFGTPLTMRGFESWSLGPVDHYDTLGGEVTVGGGLSASMPLPVGLGGSGEEKGGPRLHAFVNGGSLVGRGKEGWGGIGKELWGSARWSTGIGLVIPSPIGRLEFNMVRPLKKLDTDRTRTLQIGLGLEFL